MKVAAMYEALQREGFTGREIVRAAHRIERGPIDYPAMLLMCRRLRRQNEQAAEDHAIKLYGEMRRAGFRHEQIMGAFDWARFLGHLPTTAEIAELCT